MNVIERGFLPIKWVKTAAIRLEKSRNIWYVQTLVRRNSAGERWTYKAAEIQKWNSSESRPAAVVFSVGDLSIESTSFFNFVVVLFPSARLTLARANSLAIFICQYINFGRFLGHFEKVLLNPQIVVAFVLPIKEMTKLKCTELGIRLSLSWKLHWILEVSELSLFMRYYRKEIRFKGIFDAVGVNM